VNISLLYNVFMGENSPLIAARIDSQAYEMGAKLMENVIPMITGGLRKRPGTWFDGTTEDDKEARLIDWLLSDGTVLILELTAGSIRLWRDSREFSESEDMTVRANDYADALLLILGRGEHEDLKETPDDTEKANENADALLELLGIDAADEEKLILFNKYIGPYRVIQRITNQYEVNQLQSIHYAASANSMWLVHPEHRPMKLSWNGIHIIKSFPTFTGKDFTAENDRPGAIAFDSGRLCFAGTYNEPNRIYMSRAPDSQTGQNRYTDFTTEDRYMTEREISTIAFNEDGSMKMEEVRDKNGEIVYETTVNEKGEIIPTEKPRTQPVYVTHTEETENISITSSHAIVLEENDMHGSRIKWIAANKRFITATERATWSDTGEIPTPATFDMNIIEYAGANELQARGTKEIMVYAGRSGKSLRALVMNETAQGQGFVDMDISEQASHLFGAGIKDFAVADYPYPMLWIVTKAGELISCTINIRAGILAYAKHPTDGKVEAVAVAPQAIGDNIFLVVQRGEKRNVEHLELEDLVNADFSESHYVDAGERLSFTAPTRTVTGLQRFAGKTIRAFADGAVEPPVKVDEKGEIEFQTSLNKIHLGLPYKSSFSPNDRQIPANGTSMGKKHRLEKITLKLFRSLGGRAGTDEKKLTELNTKRFGEYEMGTAPQPFTGEVDVTVSGYIDTEGKLIITHDEPCPFTLLALVERVAILEV